MKVARDDSAARIGSRDADQIRLLRQDATSATFEVDGALVGRPTTPAWAWLLLVAAVGRRRGEPASMLPGLLGVAASASRSHCSLTSLHPSIPQVCADSSAGVVFTLLAEVPALTLAAWRLQLTGALLSLGAALQLLRMPAGERRRVWQSSLWLAGSGSALAVHFGAWVWSTQVHYLVTRLVAGC